MFVCGTADGIIKVSGRRHNCDDLKATILAVDPIKFVYRGRLVSQKIIYKIIIYNIIVIKLDIYRYSISIFILWYSFSVINKMFFFVHSGDIMVHCSMLLTKQLAAVNLFKLMFPVWQFELELLLLSDCFLILVGH